MQQEQNEAALSEKDSLYRNFALNGNMWRVIFHVCLPLAVSQEINHLLTILDTMMASHISAEAVSTVAYLSQLLIAAGAVGYGLAAGSGIKISEAYGAGDYDLVKKRIASLLCLCAILASCLALFIPFSPFILRLMGTPEDFIGIGTNYFNLSVVSTIIIFFNYVYIVIERTRGNAKRIMFLNTLVILLKLALTAFFIYGLGAGVTMIGLASVLSQSVLFIITIKSLSDKNSVFGFDRRAISLTKRVTGPLIALSIPVIAERFAFAMGKTIVNSMSKVYGSLTVGALGISNNINGAVTTVQNGCQDGAASIISQNLGAGKLDRALEAFKKILIINVLCGVIGQVILLAAIGGISLLFASSAQGVNYAFRETILEVWYYDSLGSCIPLGVNSAVMSLLFGFGYTRLSLLVNFCRVFVFRVPVLWALQTFTSLGSESVGIVMAVSNTATAAMAAIVCFLVVRKLPHTRDDSKNKGAAV